jgi:hypothetical protein
MPAWPPRLQAHLAMRHMPQGPPSTVYWMHLRWLRCKDLEITFPFQLQAFTYVNQSSSVCVLVYAQQ